MNQDPTDPFKGHTKEPWTIEWGRSPADDYSPTDDFKIVTPRGKMILGWTGRVRRTIAEHKANAELAAAAPRLLRENQAMESILRELNESLQHLRLELVAPHKDQLTRAFILESRIKSTLAEIDGSRTYGPRPR